MLTLIGRTRHSRTPMIGRMKWRWRAQSSKRRSKIKNNQIKGQDSNGGRMGYRT
jgi:hypothetical protein